MSSSAPLYMEERRRVILEAIKRQGRVSVKQLSERFNVSAVTIRQDLSALEDQGLVARTHGGAVAPGLAAEQPELSFNVRSTKQRAEKDALGKAAAALVQNGFGIALDASTTVINLIPYLTHLDSLTIVTNNLLVPEMLLAYPKIKVLLPGGRFRRDGNSIVGRPDTLPDVNLNIGFLSAWGVTPEAGLTEVSADEMAMKQALIAHCMRTVVLIDSSKWGQIAPYTYAYADAVDHILTSAAAPAELVGAVRQAGARVEQIAI
ncbi:MAG: DeoR/GlpR family DNA-binding transcription regulator [bacterium]|nr:DeoR/GlpR family DNA-binding transcription regulator [bacterium]